MSGSHAEPGGRVSVADMKMEIWKAESRGALFWERVTLTNKFRSKSWIGRHGVKVHDAAI